MSKFLKKLKNRSKEITTWTVGLPFTILGLSSLFKINEGEQIAGAVQNAGGSLAAGDYQTGLITLGVGILGIFLTEKGKDD